MMIDLEPGPYLLMLDFDGTLVDIAPTPRDVTVSDDVKRILKSLQEKHHQVYIISGRPAKDVEELLSPLRAHVIGLHGLEFPGFPAPQAHPLFPKIMQALEPLTRRYLGLWVENKGFTIAIHVRSVRKEEQARALQTAEQALAYFVERSSMFEPRHEPLTILRGHCVVEIRPLGASKGVAVKRLMNMRSSFFPVYIGDDESDEEAFAALPSKSLSVRVSSVKIPTKAKFFFPSPKEVLDFLRTLP